jgi:hypothetical protein
VESGIVQQDIDARVAQNDLASNFGDRRQVVEIAKDNINLRLGRGGLDQVQRTVRALSIAGGQHETSASARQIDCRQLAKPARGARDDDC